MIRYEFAMKDLKAASLNHQNDEFFNSLLKCSFDSNLRDERSLDIDIEACVAIYNEPHQLNSDFWRALDETAQSGLPDSVVSTPSKNQQQQQSQLPQPPPPPIQQFSIKLEKADEYEEKDIEREIVKKVRKKKDKEQGPTKYSNNLNNNNNNKNSSSNQQQQQITAPTSSIKKSDLENNENSSHKMITTSKVPNNHNSITVTKVETPFAEIFNIDNLESAGIRFKYKCDQCNVILDTIELLTEHETSVHKHISSQSAKKQSSNPVTNLKTVSKSKDSWQKCPDCGKR